MEAAEPERSANSLDGSPTMKRRSQVFSLGSSVVWMSRRGKDHSPSRNSVMESMSSCGNTMLPLVRSRSRASERPRRAWPFMGSAVPWVRWVSAASKSLASTAFLSLARKSRCWMTISSVLLMSQAMPS